MKMHDKIEIKLPYPIRFLGITFTRNRKIGFSFTNLSIFLFREEYDITTSNEYATWIKENGNTILVSEMLYFAALAYCMNERKEVKFSREGLGKAIALASKEKQSEIMKVWKTSQTFGAQFEKKKAKKKK